MAGTVRRLARDISRRRLLLPGALLVAVQAQFFAALVFVDLRFAAFFE
jgi:hypothetical protein